MTTANHKNWVLLTGASAGIGKEFAKIFARGKFSLILIARRKENLETIAKDLKSEFGTESLVMSADLTQTSDIDGLLKDLDVQGIVPEVLVNNAGFGNKGNFWELPTDKISQMITLNISTLVHLTRMLLPKMVKRGSGKILNVASTAAFVPGPYMSEYYATKAFVHSFSVGLSRELRGTGVSLTTLYPGPTQTEFGEVAGISESPLFKTFVMTAKDVAEAGYSGLMKKKTMVIPGLPNKLTAWTPRISSWKILANVAAYLNQGR